MKFSYYNRYIKKTTGRYDVTLLFKNHIVFMHLIDDLVKLAQKKKFSTIASIDAGDAPYGMPSRTCEWSEHVRQLPWGWRAAVFAS